MKEKEYFITVKNTQIKLKVSLRTYYRISNNDPGEYKNDNNYEISIETLKSHPRLYNQARKTT